MKSTRTFEMPVIDNNYPKLMIHRSNSFVVLFIKKSVGFVVWTHALEQDYKVGKDRVDWKDDEFYPFIGTVSLSN